MGPVNNFYEVTISLSMIDDKGRTKKKKEVHLIDAKDTNPIEKKVAEMMVDSMWDWDITSIKKSNIIEVYGDCFDN